MWPHHHDLLQDEVGLHPQIHPVEAPGRNVGTDGQLGQCEATAPSESEQLVGTLSLRLRAFCQSNGGARGAQRGDEHDPASHSSELQLPRG